MDKPIVIELRPRDEFWANAFAVEWKAQFPDRLLLPDGHRRFLADPAWISDIERIASKCFSSIIRAPESPQRRAWMKLFSPIDYFK